MDTDTEIEVRLSSQPVRRRYHRAIMISVLAHVTLAVALLFWYLPNPKPSTSAELASTQRASASPGSSDSGNAPPPELAPPPAPDIPAEQIEASIESQIEQIEKLPDEQKLSELEKNLKRLDAIASPESVDEVTEKVASTLGLDSETYQPKDLAAEGPFDSSTAQLHDVTRTRSEDGSWKYESVLVDAGGRTTTVSMSAADGETAYNTFQQLKKYPMAEGIYRSVVMPMIQRMIEAGDAAARAASEAEPVQAE